MKTTQQSTKILNVWKSEEGKLQYYYESNIVAEIGEYRIYRQFANAHLYTFRNIAINCLVGLNKEYLQALHDNKRPDESPMCFIYDRAQQQIITGSKLLNN